MALYNEGLFKTISNIQNTLKEGGSFSIKPARTKFVFLDLKQIKNNQPTLYQEYGKNFTLGSILFDSVTNPSPDIQSNQTEFNNYKFAKPLFPNIKTIPLVNEIVYIISFPTVDMQNPQFINLNNSGFYYFQPINLWNNVHHNALPNPLINDTLPPSQNKPYEIISVGSSLKVTNQPEEINLGETFQEQSNIKPLQPYEGDIIYEGRWGQSIRFGSTVKNRNNDWSSAGKDGDPILIIRNGQYNDGKPVLSKDGIEPIVENINRDSGSIYFGTTQKIPLEASSTSYSSYVPSKAPTIPNEYTSNQIIINSGRIVINTFDDHILLTSKKSINLNSVDSVNIDTPTAVFQTEKIYLGDKEANEPLLLGNRTEELLNDLISALTSFTTTCSTLVSAPAGVPLAPLNTAAVKLNVVLKKLKTTLPYIKSKDNFTV